MSAFNPYAPPGDGPVPPIDRPLPEGIRRYRLDREGTMTLLRKAALNRLLLSAVMGLGYVALFQLQFGIVVVGMFLCFWVAFLTLVFVFRRAYARRVEPRITASFEILSSPRALRRTALGIPVAEIAAIEVESMAELPEGLSIFGETRRMWIWRHAVGYAELRDRLASWGPIETRSGPAAFVRRYQHLRGQRAYDLARDAVFAREPALRGEVEALRAVAIAAPPVPKRARRLLLLWLLLVVVFLLIWQFLSPAPPAREIERPPALTL